MANKTLPTLTAGINVQSADLLIARQGADTSDVKVTAEMVKGFMRNNTRQLPHWNKALAKVMSGKGNARVLFVGDSITQGYYSTNSGSGDMQKLSFPTQFANILNSVGILANANTLTGGANSDRSVSASSLLSYGSWVYASTSGGLGGYPFMGAGAGAGTFSYSPGVPVDTFKIWYLTLPGAGQLTYVIDGGSPTNINQNVSASYTSTTVTVPFGIHTIAFTSTGGGVTNAFITSVEAYDSAKSQVLVYNAGWSASRTSDWTDNTSPWSPRNAMATFAPDVAVVCLQINDMINNVSLATYSANLQLIITALQTGGNTDVVLMTENHTNTADSNPYTEAQQLAYANVVRALALTNSNCALVTGLPVIDSFDNFVSYAFQNTHLGMMYNHGSYPNDLHPNFYGHALMARDIASVLLPSMVGSKTIPTKNNLSVYAAGTAYSLTATAAALTFGTTSPSLVLTEPGTYKITARVRTDYNGATFAAVRTSTLKLRRTNNTAADLTNGTVTAKTQVVTGFNGTFLDQTWTVNNYATANIDDAIAIFGSLDVIPTAGSFDAAEAFIVAERLT